MRLSEKLNRQIKWRFYVAEQKTQLEDRRDKSLVIAKPRLCLCTEDDLICQRYIDDLSNRVLSD